MLYQPHFSTTTVQPFTFEKEKRIMLDLMPRAADAIDILGMFYPHWLIAYREPNSEDRRMSIREIIEKL